MEQIMEEMANMPKEEFGKRQPGERGAYEKFDVLPDTRQS